MARIYALILASSLAFACGDGVVDDKGTEDNPLTDGKDDSFYRPTEHGALRMGIANPATMTDDEQFHAWTFELTGDATIELSTEVSQNLDTVMYLYQRTSPTDSWGRYKKKNDDDGELVSSRIKLEATAGEFRVVVKGFKSALRGTFAVHGECTGDGCTVSDDSCDAETFESLPSATPFTQECAYDIEGILSGARRSSSSGSIGISEKCSLTGLERTAIDFYHEFWDEIVGFDDQFRYDPDEDVFLNFESTTYTSGTVITVDAGGDEDALEMYFDRDGRLLAAFQHNQSPTIEYYCGTTGAPIEGPDESCFSDLMNNLPHDEETAMVSGDIAISDAATVHEGLGVAIDRFAEQTSSDASAVVAYEYVTWDNDTVISANIIGEDDVSAQYTVFKDYDAWKVILEVDANALTFVCE